MPTTRRDFLRAAAATLCASRLPAQTAKRPNILFFITDDQSWLDCSAYGNTHLRTPHVDRLAREGVRFNQAFVSAPSCTPSRAAICTGRNFWELDQGAVLHSPLPARYAVYQDLLEASGYAVGLSGKGWGPGKFEDGGRTRNPAGPMFNRLRNEPPLPPEFSPTDYAANFAEFLANRPAGRPFSFWLGTTEPHHPHFKDNYLKLGSSLDQLPVPSFIPDTPGTRLERGNYYGEIEYADQQLGRAIAALEATGELDNTLIVCTGDNGTPLPRAKSNLYDWGVRVPLVAWWPGRVQAGRTVDDPVSLVDLAPTFLEAAGLAPSQEMTGRSLMNLLTAPGSGYLDDTRTEVYTGLEWHGTAYPMRAIRTRTHVYIENYATHDRNPRRPEIEAKVKPFEEERERLNPGQAMIRHPEHPEIKRYREFCFGPRPPRELYEIATDPENLHNLAEEPGQATLVAELAGRLKAKLEATGDPRALGHASRFEEIIAVVEQARAGD